MRYRIQEFFVRLPFRTILSLRKLQNEDGLIHGQPVNYRAFTYSMAHKQSAPQAAGFGPYPSVDIYEFGHKILLI